MIMRSRIQEGLKGWTAAGIAAVVVAVFGALVFSAFRFADQSLIRAAAEHDADMSLVSLDVAMGSVTRLVLLAHDEAGGVAEVETVAAAAADTDRAISEFADRLDALEGQSIEDLSDRIGLWTTTVEQVTDRAAAGRGDTAAELLVADLVPAADSLADGLTAERDARAAEVEDARGLSGAMALIAGFLTVLALPVLAMAFYRRSAKRQLEVAEAHLEARLAAEKSLGLGRDRARLDASQKLQASVTSIHESSETLLHPGSVDSSEAGELVGIVNAEAAESGRIVENLLLATHEENRPVALDLSVVDIDAEIEASLRQFRGQGVEIGGTHADGMVVGDGRRIRHILRNLISNAIQHGGPTLRIFGDVAARNYVISVEDDGPGVADDIAPHLFGRSPDQAQTTPAAGSVGLGLAVARMLAEAMGGSLVYERVLDRTAFILSLPLADVQEGGDAGLDDLAVTSA